MELENKKINRFNFDKVVSKLKKIFGEVKGGEEDEFNYEACGLELHLLQAYVEGRTNDRQAIEALKTVLVKADGYLNGINYDYEALIDDKSSKLADEIASLFIPFENKALLELVKGQFELDSKEGLTVLFEKPIKSVIRLIRAIEFRDKKGGIDGYFTFIDEQLHHLLKEIDKFPNIIREVKIDIEEK